MGKRELDALLSLSPCCFVIVVWLFLKVPWVCLQFVIVVFPGHTHLLFLLRQKSSCCKVIAMVDVLLFRLSNTEYNQG